MLGINRFCVIFKHFILCQWEILRNRMNLNEQRHIHELYREWFCLMTTDSKPFESRAFLKAGGHIYRKEGKQNTLGVI